MPINIPEITVFNAVNNCLKYLRDDFKRHNKEEDTFLYRNFNGIKTNDNSINFYDQAKKLLIVNEKRSRDLKIAMGYNLERAAMPTIHVIVPSEQAGGYDGIGVDHGYQPEDDSNYPKTSTISFSRSFKAQYNLLMTSDNIFEVLIMYHVVRALIISMIPMLDAKSQMKDIRLSGQDITLQQDLMPSNINHRILAISFSYDVDVQNIEERDDITTTKFKPKIKI